MIKLYQVTFGSSIIIANRIDVETLSTDIMVEYPAYVVDTQVQGKHQVLLMPVVTQFLKNAGELNKAFKLGRRFIVCSGEASTQLSQTYEEFAQKLKGQSIGIQIVKPGELVGIDGGKR